MSHTDKVNGVTVSLLEAAQSPSFTVDTNALSQTVKKAIKEKSSTLKDGITTDDEAIEILVEEAVVAAVAAIADLFLNGNNR